MISVTIRFYEELNDFIKADLRKTQIERHLNHRTSVKDLIESFGVPHTEVDLILVNGKSVGFTYKIDHNDFISVYPVFESFDITGVSGLQERPLRNLQFVADCHLGKLVCKMRLLGLDVSYDQKASHEDLISAVVDDKRVLISRDRHLLMHKVIDRGYLVRSQILDEQIKEVIKRFDLADQLKPFTRCARCNGTLERVEKSKVLHLLEPKTRKYFNDFFQCQNCNQVYWQGSHFKAIEELISSVQSDKPS
jgi:uncharacterized protein with PIN domain